jgi:RNA polymerase sigma-70 factor (ECF subfamily)
VSVLVWPAASFTPGLRGIWPVFPLDRARVGILRQAGSGVTLHDRVAQLFEETREDVYRYLLTLGLYPPQAQEAAQEVFLRLYTTLKKGEHVENPRGWIFRVAHNYGLKVRARQASEAPFDAELEARLLAPAASPEHELIERERMVRFHRAVENLSEQQRRCLFLRLEGMRYPEIASTLGISASTVGEFLRRAMARLRKVRDE